MTLDRIELDGVSSPALIAARIHELTPDLPFNFSIEHMCSQLDIHEIQVTDTSSFEAALVMDANKAAGSILLARSSSPKRRRFSIGHELGHFLIPTHMPQPGAGFACSCDDLRLADTKTKDRHKRIEAEANRFAAHLLMPPRWIRSAATERDPDLGEIVRLADEFAVSKEAMARSYINARREALAVVVIRNGCLTRVYRDEDFPWIEPRIGQPVPGESIVSDHRLVPSELSDMEECDPEIWLGERQIGRVEVLSEQLLGQRDGYAMVLLHAELGEAD